MTMTPVGFDRNDLFPLLLKRVQSFASGYRQNVALLGREGMGKTTLLRRLVESRLPGTPPMICLVLEFRKDDPLVEWCAQFIQTLLYAVLQAGGCGELPSGWAGLLRECRDRVPRTVAKAIRVLDLAESGRSHEA